LSKARANLNLMKFDLGMLFASFRDF